MLKPRGTLIVILLLLIITACNRQVNDQQQASSATADSLQIEKLITAGGKYITANTDSVLGVAKQLHALSKKKRQ